MNRAYKPEKWSVATEAAVIKETRDGTAGAPYQVAWWGEIITVTRRCAREMFQKGMITGSRSCRMGCTSKEVKADLQKQRIEAGAAFDVTVRPSGKGGTWMLHSKAMNYEAPSKNPARDIMLLANEWWAMLEHGDGSFHAESAGDWRLTTNNET